MRTITCCQCSEPFGMSDEAYTVLKRSSQLFYCTYGHAQHFTQGETEADKVRRERDLLKQENARLAESASIMSRTATQYYEQAEHERRRANGYKGHATRISKRAKAGICPCCNRHFAALEAHMKTKHPHFTPEAPDPPALKVIAGGVGQ